MLSPGFQGLRVPKTADLSVLERALEGRPLREGERPGTFSDGPRWTLGATISHRGRTKQTTEVTKVIQKLLLNPQRESETLGDPLIPQEAAWLLRALSDRARLLPLKLHPEDRASLRSSLRRDATRGGMLQGRAWKARSMGQAHAAGL